MFDYKCDVCDVWCDGVHIAGENAGWLTQNFLCLLCSIHQI